MATEFCAFIRNPKSQHIDIFQQILFLLLIDSKTKLTSAKEIIKLFTEELLAGQD